MNSANVAKTISFWQLEEFETKGATIGEETPVGHFKYPTGPAHPGFAVDSG